MKMTKTTTMKVAGPSSRNRTSTISKSCRKDQSLLDLPWIKAGPVARFISQRTLSGGSGTLGNNDSFYGLHNVGLAAELGGFLELWPTDFFRARFRPAI